MSFLLKDSLKTFDFLTSTTGSSLICDFEPVCFLPNFSASFYLFSSIDVGVPGLGGVLVGDVEMGDPGFSGLFKLLSFSSSGSLVTAGEFCSTGYVLVFPSILD
jgi:hypothetical protein